MTMLRFAICTCLVGLTASCANAGQYRLEQGKGVEVCEAYERNLRAVAPNPTAGGGMCLIPIGGTVAELRAPRWQGAGSEPLPAPIGVDVYTKVDHYIWDRGVNPVKFVTTDQRPLWRGTPEQLKQARQSFLRRRENFFSVPPNLHAWTLIDIDNDGVDEPVYHDNRGCFYGGFGSLLIVLTGGYADIDRTKTDLVMTHPPRAPDAPVFRPAQPDDVGASFSLEGQTAELTLTDDPLRSSRYDIFGYRDKNYVTYFWGFPPPSPRDPTTPVHVYLIEKDRKRELCAYRYEP